MYVSRTCAVFELPARPVPSKNRIHKEVVMIDVKLPLDVSYRTPKLSSSMFTHAAAGLALVYDDDKDKWSYFLYYKATWENSWTRGMGFSLPPRQRPSGALSSRKYSTSVQHWPWENQWCSLTRSQSLNNWSHLSRKSMMFPISSSRLKIIALVMNSSTKKK